jgi:hypothetical protein
MKFPDKRKYVDMHISKFIVNAVPFVAVANCFVFGQNPDMWVEGVKAGSQHRSAKRREAAL